MIPRTVQAAKTVATVLSAAEIDNYGNIVLNGYATTGPNVNNIKAWQWPQTITAPVNLPSITTYSPALKGWTTNYMSYFTRSGTNYSLFPGQENPFQYTIWNWYQNPGPIGATGPIVSIDDGLGGNKLVPGQYLVNAPGMTGGYGAVLDILVQLANPADPSSGGITQINIVTGGTGYIPGDGLIVTGIPHVPGPPPVPFKGTVLAIGSDTVIPAAGYSQCPRRFYQNQVASSTPPQNINNPQAISYSFMHPVQTSQTPPPIDYVAP